MDEDWMDGGVVVMMGGGSLDRMILILCGSYWRVVQKSTVDYR